MAEWIVVIATVSDMQSMVLTDLHVTSPVEGVPAVYTPPPAPPPPCITVVKAKSREEAEAQARGYYQKNGTTWTDEKLAVPGMFSFSTSRSVVVIAPDGLVYRVYEAEKKRRVVREVEEPDGWETRWDEVKP